MAGSILLSPTGTSTALGCCMAREGIQCQPRPLRADESMTTSYKRNYEIQHLYQTPSYKTRYSG